MRKVILLPFLSLFFSTVSYSQKLTISDLKLLAANTTDEVAEDLIEKGFEFYNDGFKKQQGCIYKKGNEDISLKFDNDDPLFRYKLVIACYSTGFNLDYTKIVSLIKAKGKKLSFFFYPGYKIYMTEYLIDNDTYVYVCKGWCKDLKGTKLNNLFISNQSIKP
jgi:hypothetical protein